MAKYNKNRFFKKADTGQEREQVNKNAFAQQLIAEGLHETTDRRVIARGQEELDSYPQLAQQMKQ